MIARIFSLVVLFLALISCKKDKANNSGPTTVKVPVLNAQEQSLAGNWHIDSIQYFNAASVYTSHVLPDAQTEPRVSFMVTFDCSTCSDIGFYKAALGKTPGVFAPGVWSAQVTDTLRLGEMRTDMAPFRILVLNSTELKLKRSTGANGEYCLYHYHRTN